MKVWIRQLIPHILLLVLTRLALHDCTNDILYLFILSTNVQPNRNIARS